MTENEKLDRILSEVTEVNAKVSGLQAKMAETKEDVAGLRNKVTDLALHIENITDKGLSVLAENHLSLNEKMNRVLRVAEDEAIYQVKVNYLAERVAALERDLAGRKAL